MSSAQSDEMDDSAAPLVEHLAELRQRLIYSVSAFVVCVFIVFYVWNPVFLFLTEPICNALEERGQECALILVKLQEGFFVAIRIALMGGFALAFPFIGYQLWRFVAPGLYKSERGAFLPFLLASPIMFFIGASFTYYIVMPLAFDFFLNFQSLTPEGDVTDAVDQGALDITFTGSMAEYLSLSITFIMAFGLCFQLPVLLTLLGKAGLVSSLGLAAVRKYAVVAILLLAGIVTPPDVITQVILFVAVYGLYEISIWLVRRVERRRKKRMQEEGTWDDDWDEVPGDDFDPDAP